MKNNSDESKNNFAELLEKSMSPIQRFEPGQLVETKIVSISADCIFLDLGGKSEGQLNAAEMIDKDGKLTVKEGETIKAFFLYVDNGEYHFTTRISGDKVGRGLLEQAFENKIPIEGVVEKEIKGGFEIKIGDSRAFCPYSQMDRKRVDDAAQYIGKHLTFQIQEYSENGRNIIVSNRAILEEEHKAEVEVLKKTLSENMKVKATVKKLQDFGAFVDISGIQALLPISEISRSRVDDINAALSLEQEIEVVIMNLDWKNERISVSMKKLLADPWDEAKDKYTIGSRHTGKIVRLVNFGAFVSLEPGLDGLIHISDLESDRRLNHPGEVVKLGQSINIEINSVDIENKKLSLKPVSESLDGENYKQYLEPDTDTYNPFEALLNKKDKKKDNE